MHNSSVSVIIPCYNRASLVGETIENMLRQTLAPHEVIVVDDGSTDDSAAVVQSFGAPVKLIQQANAGPASACNTGLAAATGRFIQIIGSDDLASLNKFEVQTHAMIASGAEMAFGPFVQLSLDGQRVTHLGEILQPVPPKGVPLSELHLRGNWMTLLLNCLFSRDFLNRIGAMKEDLIGSEDFEYLNRILLATSQIVFTSECLAIYRLDNPGKLTGSDTPTPKKLKNLAQAYIYMQKNVEDARLAMDAQTRFWFAFRCWQLWREMSAQKEFPPELMAGLRSLSAHIPSNAFLLAAVGLRVYLGIRCRIVGSRWAAPYQARKCGEREFALIREAGLNISTI